MTYEKHQLVTMATTQLQEHLRTQREWQHNFGLGTTNEQANLKPIGKMFGVLVVQTENGALGFLAGFSGKLAGGNHHSYFVPPVYDSLTEKGFLNLGMHKLKVINDQVRELKLAGCKTTGKLLALQQERKALSQSLQHQLFESYRFLNTKGQTKNPYEIFGKTPPAGAGECAAPKLLHYAYQQNLTPLAIVEFWWGVPPTADAASRSHGQFYPACEHKCRGVLGWMLN
ncbi:MAG: pseudouridylate synthase [Bacteroidia bacterium]